MNIMQRTTAPSISIIGEVTRNARTQRMFSRNSFREASRNLRISKPSMPNAFTTRLPLMVSCRIWLRSASRERLFSVDLRIFLPNFATGYKTSGIKTTEPMAMRQSITSSTAINATSAKIWRKKSTR